MTNLYIRAAGMVTCVGQDAAASCAAMRGRLDGFAETRFMGSDGKWLVGAAVPLPRNWIGLERMAHLAAGALTDLQRQYHAALDGTPILLCLAEENRPGRPVPDPAALARLVAGILGLSAVPRVQVVANGRPSGFIALDWARRLIAAGKDPVVILGLDSYLTAQTVAHYLRQNRLSHPDNANGFIPGEAAAAVLCTAAPGPLRVAGLGLAREPACIYNSDGEGGRPLPLRAEGMSRAHGTSLAQAGCRYSDIVLKMGDLIGEAYWFKQMALAMQRLQRELSDVQSIWPLAASLGNVGAAASPVLLGWAMTAATRGYVPPGPILLEAAGDDGVCGAAVVHPT